MNNNNRVPPEVIENLGNVINDYPELFHQVLYGVEELHGKDTVITLLKFMVEDLAKHPKEQE